MVIVSRRKLICRAAALAAAAAVAWGTPPPPAQAQGDIVVFAAASLKDALDAINAEWQKETGKKATISYAASSVLAKQIEQDAPAQIFISADLDWMDYVEQKKLIKPESRVNLLGNRIVLIARKDKAQPVEIRQGFDLAKLIGGGYLALANVDSVPAGKYAKAALEKLNVWSSVADKVAQSADVRAACYVSRAARRLWASSIRPMPPPIRTLRSLACSPITRTRRSSIPSLSPQKRAIPRPKPFMRISGARRPRRDSRRRASPSSTKPWPTRRMGLAVSVRGVNGFRLSRKRLHDSGDLRTKIAWCSPESISPQIPMSAARLVGTRTPRRRRAPSTTFDAGQPTVGGRAVSRERQRHAWRRDCASRCVAAAERQAAALSVKVVLPRG